MLVGKEDLRNQLRRREFAPVYTLFGEEPYLRDLAASTIADLAFAEGDLRDFNETTINLTGKDDILGAIDAARQLPMMATRRVVRVTSVRVSTTAAKDTLPDTHEAAVAAYLDDPSPHSVLVFVADELNGARKIGKMLREKTIAAEFARLDDRELSDWARREIADQGSTADDIALRLLVQRAGNDVRRLSNEVRKLAAAAMPDGLITADLVEQLVPNSRELSNFDLTDHLIAGRRRDALGTLKKILDDGAEPLALLGLISYNYRRLVIARELMDRNAPRAEVASAAKLFGRGQDAFLASARRADARKLARSLELIAQTDLAIKTSIGGSGPAGARLQIEMLVCELAI